MSAPLHEAREPIRERRRTPGPVAAGQEAARVGLLEPASLLRLQRSAGNAAVTAAVRRNAAAKAKPPSPARAAPADALAVREAPADERGEAPPVEHRGKDLAPPPTAEGNGATGAPRARIVQQAGSLVARLGVARQTLLQRQDKPAPAPAAALPSAEELTTRIARCIGIWETNRTKDEPAPKESGLDTVAGIHASYATIEQATEPYAIDVLKKHPELWIKATPPLTKKEVNDAGARVEAVPTLLSAVAAAAAKGTKPEAFIKDSKASITPTGLSDENVKTMFSAVELKKTVDAARAELAGGKKTMKDELAAIPQDKRLGLGEGSLKSYINKAEIWGENRAAWQRAAVEAMPDNIGARIKQVAESDKGTALATPTIRGRVDSELAKKPQPTLEEIVKKVGQQNNPGETDYGTNIWLNYQRLYPAPAAAPAAPAKPAGGAPSTGPG